MLRGHPLRCSLGLHEAADGLGRIATLESRECEMSELLDIVRVDDEVDHASGCEVLQGQWHVVLQGDEDHRTKLCAIPSTEKCTHYYITDDLEVAPRVPIHPFLSNILDGDRPHRQLCTFPNLR